MNIPNAITVARLIAVPFFMYALLEGEFRAAFFIFLVAGLSDAVDGYLARRWSQHSEFGAWLDPIADKLLMASAYGLLGYLGHLPAWLVLLVIGRDILIVAAVLAARTMEKSLEVRPIFVSKANTAAQVFLAVLVLANLAYGFAADHVVWAIVLATAGLTILSGAAYFNIWIKHIRGVAAP